MFVRKRKKSDLNRKIVYANGSLDDVPSRVDTLRSDYRPGGGDVEIFDEKRSPKAKPKVDSRNRTYIRQGGDVEVG
jgi:hypothetical protein